jgi:glycerophosphoryl diester phosphodiesterase
MENRFRAILADAGRKRTCPLIIAHRGDSSRAPENTLDAALLGWEARAEAWELDVQLSRDGVPVVIHDESLLRTTDVSVRFERDPRRMDGFLVSDFDLEEIRSLDAGSWFLDSDGSSRTADWFGTRSELSSAQLARYASGAVRVPTLAEALELTVELDWLVNIELKSFPNTSPRLLDGVLKLIDRTASASRVVVSSFDHADVARAARLRPDVATGVLAATPVYRPEGYVREVVGAELYHPSAEVMGAASDAYRRAPSAGTLRTDDLRALRERSVPVFVYTVNKAELASHLAEAGVAGLFTDHPTRMFPCLDEQ